jgi:hypothetical protein
MATDWEQQIHAHTNTNKKMFIAYCVGDYENRYLLQEWVGESARRKGISGKRILLPSSG